ncbi:cathepsin L-like [Glandiceps talaboti]
MAKTVLLFFCVGIAAVTSNLLGGREDVSLDDDGVLKAANFAVDELNKKMNSLYRSKLMTVTAAEKQVVAGMNYFLTIEIGTTLCHNNDVSSLDQCEFDPNGNVHSCEIEVYVRAWENVIELKKDTCSLVKDKTPAKRDVVDWSQLDQFQDFILKYNKKYSEDEFVFRYKTFLSNLDKAAELQRTDQATGKYGVTQFMDLTKEEFAKYYLSPVWPAPKTPVKPSPEFKVPTTAPDSADWRDKGAVTGVKNQGSCGSCWAFSTTGNIEGQWQIKKKQLISLSEQDLVDCDKLDEGCNGGLPSNAYQEIIRMGGLMTEKDYPYKGVDGSCHFNRSMAKIYINGSMNISQDEGEIASWLAANGPISIGINANAMQFYFGGISHPWEIFCNPNNLDHGVLIVGYGTKNGTPYWIIKNSWGESWGEEGYYLVYRGAGVCGLNKMCTSAIIN